MNTASVTISTSSLAAFASDKEIFFGSTTSTSLASYLGSVTINLPSSMHSGTAAKTYIVASQLDNGATSRAKLSFSYSVAANCQTATIYFRDTTETLANSTSISVSYIVTQDRT